MPPLPCSAVQWASCRVSSTKHCATPAPTATCCALRAQTQSFTLPSTRLLRWGGGNTLWERWLGACAGAADLAGCWALVLKHCQSTAAVAAAPLVVATPLPAEVGEPRALPARPQGHWVHGAGCLEGWGGMVVPTGSIAQHSTAQHRVFLCGAPRVWATSFVRRPCAFTFFLALFRSARA